MIFTVFVVVDLAIVGAVAWCALQRLPVREYLVPALVFFFLNGFWLLWMTLRHTPPRT